MRYAFHLKIRPGTQEEYDRRHSAVWEEMKEMLRKSGVRNYSIYRDELDVFGYWECDDLSKTLEMINSSKVNREWQSYMNDVIVTSAAERTGAGLKEVFHLS